MNPKKPDPTASTDDLNPLSEQWFSLDDEGFDSAAKRPVKILVIDDEARITRMLQVILQRHGYEVHVANNGLEGVRLAKTHQPDLVVLDLMMPQLDGYDLVEVLRSGSATRDIPIVVLSAKSAQQDAGKSFQKGANCFMQKPFRLRKFLSLVEQLIANPHAQPTIDD